MRNNYSIYGVYCENLDVTVYVLAYDEDDALRISEKFLVKKHKPDEELLLEVFNTIDIDKQKVIFSTPGLI